MLRVRLGAAVDRAGLDRLIDEFQREHAASSGDDPGDVIAWLARRGIPAEIVPVAPGMF